MSNGEWWIYDIVFFLLKWRLFSWRHEDGIVSRRTDGWANSMLPGRWSAAVSGSNTSGWTPADSLLIVLFCIIWCEVTQVSWECMSSQRMQQGTSVGERQPKAVADNGMFNKLPMVYQPISDKRNPRKMETNSHYNAKMQDMCFARVVSPRFRFPRCLMSLQCAALPSRPCSLQLTTGKPHWPQWPVYL